MTQASASTAAREAEKLLQAMKVKVALKEQDIEITASIGIALYPADGEAAEALLLAGSMAMSRAKNLGRNRYQYFTAEYFDGVSRRLKIERALRGAIERQEMELFYQPQQDMWSGQLSGCEALIRWTHPELGAVSPGEFIPIAEESSQILAIDEWVIKTATSQMAFWLKKGILNFTVAVNLSAMQFNHQNLFKMVEDCLRVNGLPARFLELEITERLMMSDAESAAKILDQFHRLGVKVAIDDFGTGYSSLSYLKRFKLHKLKIDQSFVGDLVAGSDDASIVSAVITLAEGLGLQTIAEGVETEEQKIFLQDSGCNEMQGYLYSHPLPAGEFERFVKSSHGYT